MSNQLKNSSSPYLLQHANNPVNWFPWGKEALEKAKKENKLILVSIGYSACHWCHVMEHESFENEEVAELMNRFFVCIKVDREERPDIDQIYMTAVQLMTGRGGWPLNCFCLPDQRPIYGGTYFPKQDWINLLTNLAHFYETKPDEAEDYAVKLTDGIKQSDKLNFINKEEAYTEKDLKDILEPWKMLFDFTEGGHNRAPKFPMPNNWSFLMKTAHILKDEAAHVIVRLTLDKMAAGGIYDHLGGGFARYSVDGKWHIPHFEKMLYDNGQLISLYADAYKWCGEERYKEVVYETYDWLKREMTSSEGGFYAALDADSEGVEGKFYTWDKKEIDKILGKDAEIFDLFYQVTDEGNWDEEHINNLWVRKEKEEFAGAFDLTENDLNRLLKNCRDKLLTVRNKRIHPGLDDKILTSWNALMLKGLVNAYQAFADEKFLDLALQNISFIQNNLMKEDGVIYRNYKDGKASISGFLDDYALLIDALISLYEATFNQTYLTSAKALTDYVLDHFTDESSGMFFYTSNQDEALIARKYEVLDNVIPASNSVMAWNLKKLGLFFDNKHYQKTYQKMLMMVFPKIKSYASGYSNWASLLLEEITGSFEIAITGPEASLKRKEIEKLYIPNKIILGGKDGNLPLLQDKFVGETKIFVCKDKSCKLPVSDVSEVIKQIFE
ncbi:thioredoxin domain-containing protein [Pedobacter sp. SD-b]|uniref:Thioredoxin domain-containing protein n=1 Tax=Pedobacter segetis TaxID=2793069 RepID=A0ABS1BMV6_9SPHI|nr:thioredoxin domain-containing protein [Pedobacter segetis]MBK0384225.1 thioredoxin domain-containing protein [Pedobacter segetis]